MIYLDSAATTNLSSKVLEAMIPYMTEQYGNAGSVHSLGRKSAKAIENARAQVASLIGAEPEQIVFTSGGSEANSLAIKGVSKYLNKWGNRHIITSSVEHESVIKAIDSLCNKSTEKTNIKHEFYSSYVPVNELGSVVADEVSNLLTKYTGLVSIMYANNEVGSVNPIEEIGHICRKSNIIFHTDCVQAAGFYDLNVKRMGCDLLSLSAHKIHGPKGTGALFVRDKNYISPLINGGGTQEFGLRGGTENIPGIVGFGEACKLAAQNLKQNAESIAFYKTYFYNCLCTELKKFGSEEIIKVNGLKPEQPGKILNLLIEGVDSETLVLLLDSFEVYVSSGSACQNHSSEPSHVLLGMGLSPEHARNSVRISFSETLTVSDILSAATILAKCIRMLTKMK